jgi:integrase
VRFLSKDEENRLRKAILHRFPAFIHQLDLSLHTGMRAGEQFGLKWEQVALDRKIITLPKTKRHIPLNSIALSALRELKTSTKGHVFPSALLKARAYRAHGAGSIPHSRKPRFSGIRGIATDTRSQVDWLWLDWTSVP